MPPAASSPRVLLACSGLGHVARGFETATEELAQALRGQVSLTVARGGGAWRDGDGVRLPCLQRRGTVALRALHLPDARAYLVEQRSFAPWAYSLARLGRFDVVHVLDPGLLNALWHARRVLGGTFSIVFTNGGPLTPEHLTRADLVQCVTPLDAERLAEAGFAPSRYAIVPHGLSPSRPAPRRFAEGDPLTLVGVGALNDSHKGFATAIRAAALVPPARLRLLGQRTAETADLEDLGRSLLGDAFSTATVSRDQIGGELAAANVFVLPTHYEGFCIAVLEAMDAGIPCVVSDIPVLRWLTGDAALLLPTDEPDAWAAALKSLTAEERRGMSQRGRERAATFHWDRLVPEYRAMYETASGRRNSEQE